MSVKEILQQHGDFASLISEAFFVTDPYIFDLAAPDNAFKDQLLSQQISITATLLKQANATLGVGLYAERRDLYRCRKLFVQKKIRDLHLGLDLTVPVGTPVMAPLSGIIHSFADNQGSGDYGPTIILQHELQGVTFYTLYGHLARKSLNNINEGQAVNAGETFAWVGAQDENGFWVPHLHVQIIEHIGDYKGDYPGACHVDEQEYYLNNCPNPNLILGIKNL